LGRASTFKPEHAVKIVTLCRLGATDEELASFFDVDSRTINRWKIGHPEFCQALKAGKLESDMKAKACTSGLLG
jgi:hypothetical protein